MTDNFSSSKKEANLRGTSNEPSNFQNFSNTSNPLDLKLQEISRRMQRDSDKVEVFHKYNLENIAEQKEKLSLYLKVIEGDEKSLNLEENNETPQNNILNGETYLHLKTLQNKYSSQDVGYKFALENSSQMTEYLESKLDLLRVYRMKKFNEYHREKFNQKRSLVPLDKKNPLFETKKINEIMNKNALKIEKQLLGLFNLDDTSSDGSETDESVTKKLKVNADGITSVKQIGYKSNELLKIQKYSLDPIKLPLFSNVFDDAKDANFISISKGLSKTSKTQT